MEYMQTAGKVAAAVETWDEFLEDVVAHGTAMVLEVDDKVITCLEA